MLFYLGNFGQLIDIFAPFLLLSCILLGLVSQALYQLEVPLSTSELLQTTDWLVLDFNTITFFFELLSFINNFFVASVILLNLSISQVNEPFSD